MHKQKIITGILLVATFTAASANAYWIRPVFADGALFQDGLDINGATSDEQFFSDAAREVEARVDIGNGSVGVYTRIGDPGVQSAGQALYSNSLFGETITFNGGASSSWDFSLDVDGYLEAEIMENPNGPGPEGPTFDFIASIAVFEGNTAGTLPLQWASQENLATALFYEEVTYQSVGSDSVGLFETISGSLDVAANDSFDIVIRMYAGCRIGSTETGYCEMDFLSTAQFGTTADPSTFTSSSGEFLGSAPTVPVPGAIWLFSSGILALLGIRRRAAAHH